MARFIIKDHQWEIIKPFVISKSSKKGRPRTIDDRLIVEAVFYVMRTGIGVALIVQQNLVSHPNIFSYLSLKPLAEQLVNLSQASRKSWNWILPFSFAQMVASFLFNLLKQKRLQLSPNTPHP